MLTFVKKSEEPFARSFVKARVRNRKKSKNKITFYLLCKIETLAFIDACVECSIETMPYGINPHQWSSKARKHIKQYTSASRKRVTQEKLEHKSPLCICDTVELNTLFKTV